MDFVVSFSSVSIGCSRLHADVFLCLTLWWQLVVNAIVDTLKTAFPRSEPQSPTEEAEGDSDGKNQPDGKKIR